MDGVEPPHQLRAHRLRPRSPCVPHRRSKPAPHPATRPYRIRALNHPRRRPSIYRKDHQEPPQRNAPAHLGRRQHRYGLKELAKALSDLGALPRYDDHKSLTTSGVGRNVDLFDYLRKWAYTRRGSYQDQAEWEAVVLDRAILRNEDKIANEYTRGALSHNEVTHIARSVARWTWRNIAPIPTDEWLKQKQAERGHRSAQKRWGENNAKTAVKKLIEVPKNA